MGLVFNNQIAKLYEAWYQSQYGRALDRSIEQLFVSLVEPKRGDRLLDIGCGTGNQLITFSRMGLYVSGVDASPSMIQKARERLGTRAALKTGLAEDLPFEDNEFDIAVLNNTLEYLDHPLEALREAGRVAGKKVFIGALNSLSWNGLQKRILGRLGNPLFSRTKLYNIWQLKNLIQKAYGPTPLSWGLIKTYPSNLDEICLPPDEFWKSQYFSCRQFPFAFFMGVSARMVYKLRTDPLKLKIGLKKPRCSVFSTSTFEDVRLLKGPGENERSLSV